MASVPTVATVSTDAGGEGVFFDGEDDFGGGAEGVLAVRHEESAGVAAEAGDREAVAGGRGDAGDDADRGCLRARAGGLARCGARPRRGSAWGEAHGGERAGEAGGSADVGEGACGFGGLVGFVEGVGAGGVECAGEQAGAEAADAEAGGLFGGEHDEFDGAAGAEAAAFEGADGFEAAEDADGAVVHAGVGDGVDVRAGGDGGEVGFGAEPADEGVADGVLADLEVFRGGEFFEPGAGAEVVGREDDAGDGGAVADGFDVGEGGEDLELVEEAGGVDLERRRSEISA